MTRFPDNVSTLFPVTLAPCLPDDGDITETLVITFDEPDNLTCCQLLAPLASHFYPCGATRHQAGYDCDVVLLPMSVLTEHLQRLSLSTEPDPLVELLQKRCRRFARMQAEYLRITLPRREQHFGIEQQIWGHEHAGQSPALRHRAHQLTGDICDFCGYHSEKNPLIFRDSNPDNTTDNNLGVACAVCVCSRHLNRLGANDGVMVYLPELAPADLSHLLRAVIQARQHGDERQKKGAADILNWLAEHRQEAEAFWGTSHPGEFGHALMQARERQREDLQQRLRHIALVPNPDLLAGHIPPATMPPDAWLSLLDTYRSQP